MSFLSHQSTQTDGDIRSTGDEMMKEEQNQPAKISLLLMDTLLYMYMYITAYVKGVGYQ